MTLVDPATVDCALTVFITVRLDRHTTSTVSRFETEILKDPAVLECYWNSEVLHSSSRRLTALVRT